MQVKICGMRVPENIQDLAQLRIDMIGYIFYEKSKRFVEQDGIVESLSLPIYDNTSRQAIPKVGVFVNAEIGYIVAKAKTYNLTYIQLHGQENLFYCQKLKKKGLKLIKAFSIDEHFNFTLTNAYDHLCEYFIFDTKGINPGGNGISFDWKLLDAYQGNTPFLLSGGIGPESIAALGEFSHPAWAGLDLNSRFESSPGNKQVPLIRSFLADLREARILKTELPNWD